MKILKINFCDLWKGFHANDNFFTHLFHQWGYQVVISEDPDYVIYSFNGCDHLKYKRAIKIYFTGENDTPNFNLCDYAMGFHHISFEDRYFRFPLYHLYNDYVDRIHQPKTINKELLNRKFCNFVYSNSQMAEPIREKFYWELSKYKKVDSGGRYLNNIGGRVVNKLDFIKDYKFTIAFENSLQSGYSSEKIIEPMVVNSLPIYWGDPRVEDSFNKKSIIYANEFGSVEEIVEEVIRLDKDDDAYLQKLSEPWLTPKQQAINKENELKAFFQHIFDQPLDKAKRIADYGFQQRYRKYQKVVGYVQDFYKLIF